MAYSIIKQLPDFNRSQVFADENTLRIAEMFSDTLQGEGVNMGVPATFLRLQGCTLRCNWCDTLNVWPHGNPYSIDEVLNLLQKVPGLINRLADGQHLVLTGGSPLKQQKQLLRLLVSFEHAFGFLPYVECENECVLMPDMELLPYIDCWNNSPKLANSGMRPEVRVKPEVLEMMNRYVNSWFKFVIDSEDDWKEIEKDYLPHIDRESVILMPCADSVEKLNYYRGIVSDIAIRENVRFSDRLHITLWNKLTAV